jgi:hypothetical protein
MRRSSSAHVEQGRLNQGLSALCHQQADAGSLRNLVLQVLSAASGFGDDPESFVQERDASRCWRHRLAFADVVTAPEFLRANFSPKLWIFRDRGGAGGAL